MWWCSGLVHVYFVGCDSTIVRMGGLDHRQTDVGVLFPSRRFWREMDIWVYELTC